LTKDTDGCNVDTTEHSVSGPVAMSADKVSAFCDFHEGYVSRNITLADSKAGLVLVAYTSLLVVLMKDPGAQTAFRSSLFQIGLLGLDLGSTVLWLGTMFCLTGIILAFLVLAPRLGNSNVGSGQGWNLGSITTIGMKPPHNDNKVTYFGEVATFDSAQAYAAQVAALSAEDINADRLEHLFQLSSICWRKMALLKWAMWIGAVGLPLLVGWEVFVAPVAKIP
jgi:hypothetical protein